MRKRYPILEFDPEVAAIIQPHFPGTKQPLPEKAILCFFQEVIKELNESGKLEKIGESGSEMGPNPFYQMKWNGQKLLVFHPGVGAALAGGFLEEAIAGGARKFIACGGAGVLQKEIVVGHPVILNAAVRDEGTSYHYLPPGREVAASPRPTAALEETLRGRGLAYRVGKSWTTDGLYRETVAKRRQRVREGCLVVEMEAAAFFAVAQFRGVEFGQIVYGGDLVVPEGWDTRQWLSRKDSRQLLFWLAVETCSKL
jgi:uridine phosphorylase